MGLTTAFDISAGDFIFTDVNPYGAEGIALADVEGIITVTAPDGTVWHQGVYTAPDIVPNVSLTNTTIVIPTDASGDIQVGTYTIVYEITVSGAVQPGVYSKSYTIEYCDNQPVLEFDLEVDCLCGVITGTDATQYTTTDGTWTVNTRTLTLRNASVFASPQTTTSSTSTVVVNSNIYLGTWTWGMEVKVELVTATHTCLVTLAKQSTFEVACGDVCNVYCCLKALNTRYTNAKNAGDTYHANEYGVQLSRVSALLNMMQLAVDCGKNADANNLIAEIKTILNCTDDCGCGTEPRLLVPLCSSTGGVTYTFAAGAGLSVTNVAGNVTYSLSTANANILAAVYNTTVTAGTGITVTGPVITAGQPPVHDYTVALSATYTGAFIPLYSCYIEFDYLTYGWNAPATISNETIYDPTGSTVTPAITLLSPSANNVNSFQVANWNPGSAGSKAILRVLEWEYADATANSRKSRGPVPVRPELFDMDNLSFVFKLYDACNGVAWPGAAPGSVTILTTYPPTFLQLSKAMNRLLIELIILK